MNCLRTHWHAGNLKAAIAIGQGSGVGAAFNPYQRPWQWLAGDGIANYAMDGYGRILGSSSRFHLLLRRQQCRSQ